MTSHRNAASRTKARLLTATILSAIASAGGAWAQGSASDRVVVTGSLIPRDPNLAAPAPVQSVTAEDILLSGEINIIDIIDDLPALVGSSTSAQYSVTASATGPRGTLGGATLDLRNLGTERTLVLVDGRRHVSGLSGEASVDVNTIPAALVERVEVLTGGASAVYGADAVTGVVNFIMKDDFEGLDIRAQGNASDTFDAESVYFSGTAGKNFDSGAGNITGNFTYEFRDNVRLGHRSHTRGDRVPQVFGNPAYVVQAGDIAAYGLDPLLLGESVEFYCDPGDTTLGAGQSALCGRIDGAPSLAVLPYARFNLSSYGSLIGVDFYGDEYLSFFPGDPTLDYGADGLLFDLNNNGIEDCYETVNGTQLQRFGGFAGCHVTRVPGAGADVFQDGILADSQNAYFGGDGTFRGRDMQDIIPQTERYLGNVSMSYDLSPAVRWFGEGKYVWSETIFDGTGTVNGFVDSLVVDWENPYIPGNLRDAITEFVLANPGEFTLEDVNILLGRDMTDLGAQPMLADRETFRIVTGLEGDIGNSAFDFEVSYNYGRTEVDTQSYSLQVDRFYAAVDAVVDSATGNVVCRSELDPTAEPPGSFLRSAGPFRGFLTFDPGQGLCRPLNLFGVGAPSPEAAAFVMTETVSTRRISQNVLNATVTGDSSDLFVLPAGPVGVAAGVEYRKETSRYYPDPLDIGRPDPIGVLDSFSPLFDVSAPSSITVGEFDVKEAFAELSIPLVSNVRLIEDLSVEGAYRYSDYSTLGGAESWSARGSYSPISDLRFRGTLSRTVRAPNIAELFSPLQSITARPVDPCAMSQLGRGSDARPANCAAAGLPPTFVDPLTARISGFRGGNPNLDTETADTITAGVVFQPSAAPGLSVTFDFYEIEIADAIDAVDIQQILNACYDATTFPNQYCNLFTRDTNPASPTYLGLQSFTSTELNFENITTRGFDYAIRYSFDLESIWSGLAPYGGLTLALAGNHVIDLERREDPADPTVINDLLYEFGQPADVVNGSVRWRWGDLTLTWGTTYYGEFLEIDSRIEIENASDVLNAWVEQKWRHDVAAEYRLSDALSLYGGVNNIFDSKPILTDYYYPVGLVGTEFFIGATVRTSAFGL